MRILVYGAGVLGSLYAARLNQDGHQVSLLARGQHYEDIRKHGLVLEDALTGERETVFVNVVDQLGANDDYELVIVLMRKSQIPTVLPVLAANQHTPTVLFLGNNAAGFDAYVQALGRERVLFGFAMAGGVRKDNVISYIAGKDGTLPIILGEIDGQMTSRLHMLAAVFKSAKMPVTISKNIDAWLKTHVALVSPLANAIYAVGGDNYRLAHTRDAIVLGIRAVREGFDVLRALRIPIEPLMLRLMFSLPEPLLVNRVRGILDTKTAEFAMAGHANAARDEMRQLADEFGALVRQSGLETPSINYLYKFLDPATAPMPEGSASVTLDWRGVVVAFEAVAALVAARRLWKRNRIGHLLLRH